MSQKLRKTQTVPKVLLAAKGQLDACLNIAPAFSEFALPQTLMWAIRYRKGIRNQLPSASGRVPFEDRVLVWLATHWKDEVERFHSLGGKAMCEQFDAFQLQQLDKHYYDVLKTRLGL